MDDQKTELAHPETRRKWRDRLMIILVAFGVLLTLLWCALVTYSLGWLAWNLLR
jgi:hypothetical protein